MKIKPILFNTEMVRAIQTGTKTATRRVVKFLPGFNPKWTGYVPDGAVIYGSNNIPAAKPPYRPGDILYVRETWCDPSGEGYPYLYKADMPMHWNAEDTEIGIPVDLKAEDYKWRPSIHMPREAARIFLRVTDARAQCVQDITEEKARKEGCKDREDFRRVWDYCYSEPLPVKAKGIIHHYESYPWEDIQETRTYRGKPWYVIGNPWVWVIEFERCERQEGDGHGD